MRDTKYTNPDSIRLLYLNPKNPLKNVDDDRLGLSLIETGPALPPSSSPSGTTGGGIGGQGGGGGGGGCPALGQYTLAWEDAGRGVIIPKFIDDLIVGLDKLWHPIKRYFQEISHIRYIDAECVYVRTFDDADQIVSLSHPEIQSLDDENGTPISDMLANLEASHKAVSCIDFGVNETEIAEIRSVGRRTVAHISLVDGFIYACGSNPLRTVLGHNKIAPVEDNNDKLVQ